VQRLATVFTEIRFLKDCAEIVGTDLKTYGPFKKDDVAALPKENASILIKLGIAEPRYAPAKKPTLKEMFKGTVLTPYVEAAKVKPLEIEPGEIAKDLTEYVSGKLALLGIPDEEVDSETQRIMREAAAQPDERAYADEQIEIITKREEAKMEEEERIEKARERAEKLLGEIREVRGIKAVGPPKEVKVYSPIIMKPEDNFDKVFDKLISEGWGVNAAEYMQADTAEEAVKLQAKSFLSLEFQPILLPNPTVRHPFINAGKFVAFHRGRIEREMTTEPAKFSVGDRVLWSISGKVHTVKEVWKPVPERPYWCYTVDGNFAAEEELRGA